MHAHRKSGPSDYAGTALRPVHWSQELDLVRRLFQDYRQWLAEHTESPGSAPAHAQAGLRLIDQLIAGLPGAYGPPRGEVILAFVGDEVVACGALRELEPRIGEIKRVFVRPDHRGPGFGPILTGAVIDRARALGYERVRVDTLPSMTAAMQFYPEMGFRPIAAFWPHPVPDARFFEYAIERPKKSA
ncbi:MAG TPA: GNAT family N-acetyltransferase [Thermoplasmata archaeon]|nr:GNAT family N-acetyltransferase [Thermoplasmata archaeon]